MFEKINEYYEKGLWKMVLVRMAVRKGTITKDQFKEITGEDY